MWAESFPTKTLEEGGFGRVLPHTLPPAIDAPDKLLREVSCICLPPLPYVAADALPNKSTPQWMHTLQSVLIDTMHLLNAAHFICFLLAHDDPQLGATPLFSDANFYRGHVSTALTVGYGWDRSIFAEAALFRRIALFEVPKYYEKFNNDSDFGGKPRMDFYRAIARRYGFGAPVPPPLRTMVSVPLLASTGRVLGIASFFVTCDVSVPWLRRLRCATEILTYVAGLMDGKTVALPPALPEPEQAVATRPQVHRALMLVLTVVELAPCSVASLFAAVDEVARVHGMRMLKLLQPGYNRGRVCITLPDLEVADSQRRLFIALARDVWCAIEHNCEYMAGFVNAWLVLGRGSLKFDRSGRWITTVARDVLPLLRVPPPDAAEIGDLSTHCRVAPSFRV